MLGFLLKGHKAVELVACRARVGSRGCKAPEEGFGVGLSAQDGGGGGRLLPGGWL